MIHLHVSNLFNAPMDQLLHVKDAPTVKYHQCLVNVPKKRIVVQTTQIVNHQKHYALME